MFFSHVFGVFFQVGWRLHVMSSYVSEGGRNTQTYRKKIRMVLLVPKADDMCVFFFVSKKVHLADDMRIAFF